MTLIAESDAGCGLEIASAAGCRPYRANLRVSPFANRLTALPTKNEAERSGRRGPAREEGQAAR